MDSEGPDSRPGESTHKGESWYVTLAVTLLHKYKYNKPITAISDLFIFLSATVRQEKFDVSLMHEKPEIAAQERMVDDGTGQVEVRGHVCSLKTFVMFF